MRTPAGQTPEIQTAIHEILKNRARELVTAYYAPSGPFAGNLFDEYGSNPPDRFTSDDFVAASLLDVRFNARAVRSVLEEGIANDLLAKISHGPLWDIDPVDLSPGSYARTLWQTLMSVPGLKGTRASKLMARKRPGLFPILDSVIRDQLKLGNIDAWAALRGALADESLRAEIDELGSELHADVPPTTLRLLDVATWMRHSQSRNARKVREEVRIKD